MANKDFKTFKSSVDSQTGLITRERSIELMKQVIQLLDQVGEHLAHVRLSGDLNADQSEHLQQAQTKNDGLLELYREEIVRLEGPPTGAPKET